MNKLLLIICFGLISLLQKEPLTIYLVGDSTMANKPILDNPERGWGQVFQGFFNETVKIENHARNGRSTKSFIDEGRWDTVMVKVNKGDYVFIQFGHNDAKKEDPKRYAEPHTCYKNNLIKFVTDCRSKGAIPILLTPIVRRKFDSNGELIDSHGEYPRVVKEVSKEFDVLFIDTNELSKKLVSQMGDEGSKALYLYIEHGKYKSLPNGKKDDTHFSEYGATKMAELVIQGIKELRIDLVNYLKAN
jgi:DNA sulfur modification protein DndE